MNDDKHIEEEAAPVEQEAEEQPIEEIDPLKELEAERDDFKDKWMRAVAEQENVRKRARRDIQDSRTFAVADMARNLLEVLDNFDRALKADEDSSNLRSGVELIQNQMIEILAGKGIKKIDVEIGAEFDPNAHEAVAKVESDEFESDCIVEIAQCGYKMGELVLRATRVVVAQ